MVNPSTEDDTKISSRLRAIAIIYYGFDDADLATIITNGLANGYVDGQTYTTNTPNPNLG